jgi:hypothetical protein
MASHHTAKSLSFLEEWIDGPRIHRSVGDLGNDRPAIGLSWNLYDHVFRLFSMLLSLGHRTPVRLTDTDSRSLKESLGNLLLWGDGFRDGKLELVLEESDDLEKSAIALLLSMGRILISGEWSGYMPCKY